MRMDQEGTLDATDVVNRYSIDALTAILKNYGEVKGAYRVAEQIIAARQENKIETTQALIAVLKPLIQNVF